MSSECAVFLDTEVFKGPRLSTLKILDLQTRTFQACRNLSVHALLILPPFYSKKGFIKEEALCLLRTNSVKEIFENNK